MSKNDGGPAFPVGSGDMRDPIGMSLRDYFAASALQGLMSIPANRFEVISCVQDAYYAADQALVERAK